MTQIAYQETTRYDPTKRRRTIRKGAERGVWLFLPAAELRAAGIDPAGPAPRFKIWARPRGSILLRLYREPPA